MAKDRDVASNTGTALGVLSAILLVALLFGGYALLTNSNIAAQLGFTQTQEAPKPNPEPIPINPQSEQRPPVTGTDAKKNKDPESSSQDSN